jgi:hypothetical protein
MNGYQRVYDRLEFKECPVFKSQPVARSVIKKAAYVAVVWCSVAGNPEFAPNDKGGSQPRFSAAPTALGSLWD